MNDTQKQDAPALADLIRSMAAGARTRKQLLGILDVRYITIGIPTFVTDQYVYFEESWEVGKTGKLGGDPEEVEKNPVGGKIILLSAIISVECIKSPK